MFRSINEAEVMDLTSFGSWSRMVNFQEPTLGSKKCLTDHICKVGGQRCRQRLWFGVY